METISQIELPREKLKKRGVHSLSNSELLAIIIETGTKQESVSEVSLRILMQFRNLAEMKNASIEEFQKVKGIGMAKAAKIVAAIELGKRINFSPNKEQDPIKSPIDAVQLVQPELCFLNQEHFHCLLLNSKNQIIYRETIFIGSLNMSIVHPREIFCLALRRSAASIICFHNHPSGDPTPSQEDILITKRLVDAGNLLGICLLDHIIIAKKKFLSLKESGYF